MIDRGRPAVAPTGCGTADKIEMATWTQDVWDLWEERAAVYEYDGGIPRQAAEKQAFLDVRERHRA